MMKRTNLKDFNINNFLMKRNIDIESNKFLWLDIHRMLFRKDEMAMNFRIKCYDENAFRKVDMAKRGASIQDLKAHHTHTVCYPSELKIIYGKYNDLMVKLQYIPSLYHYFFKLSKHENQPKK